MANNTSPVQTCYTVFMETLSKVGYHQRNLTLTSTSLAALLSSRKHGAFRIVLQLVKVARASPCQHSFPYDRKMSCRLEGGV